MGLFRFCTLKFDKLDFALWSLVLLAKPHPPLVLDVKWYIGMSMCFFFFFFAKLVSQNNVSPKKKKNEFKCELKYDFYSSFGLFGRLIWQQQQKIHISTLTCHWIAKINRMWNFANRTKFQGIKANFLKFKM